MRFFGYSVGHATGILVGLWGMVETVVPGLPGAGDSMAVLVDVVGLVAVDRFFDRHFGDMPWLWASVTMAIWSLFQ